MTNKRRSARGEIIDFDLLKIKEQIASGPKPVNVQSREEFIDRKIRRRAKKAPVETPVPPTVEAEVEFSATSDTSEGFIAEEKVVEETVEVVDNETTDETTEPTPTIRKS